MEVPESLCELVGAEHSVGGVAHTLHLAVAELHPPAAGALHVTCADESELECAAAFRRGFAQYVLPTLKFGHQAPMRIANLGGRYEWGAIRIAENHYATEAGRSDWLLMLVKLNAHVGRFASDDGARYGWLHRYEAESTCCGALHALLDGAHLPVVDELRRTFSSDGHDRVGLLLDESRIPPARRALDAAIVSARLQADTVVRDVLDHVPEARVLWIVVSAVTVNQAGPDGEVVVGVHLIDRREGLPAPRYVGLGDDPRAWVFAEAGARIRVREPERAT